MTHATLDKPFPATLEDFLSCFEKQFPRPELFSAFKAHVVRLLRGVAEEGGWRMPETASADELQRNQRLLTKASWETCRLLKILQRRCFHELASTNGVFLLGFKKFFKRGKHYVGAMRCTPSLPSLLLRPQRRPSRNHQLGIFLGYASGAARLLVGSELYLPRAWAADNARRAKAHIPPSVKHQTHTELAQCLLRTARERKERGSWVTGDRYYSYRPGFLAWLSENGLSFVFPATRRTAALFGFKPTKERRQQDDRSVRDNPAKHPRPAPFWRSLTILSEDGTVCGDEWAMQRVVSRSKDVPPSGYVLLARRKQGKREPFAFYLSNAPAGTPLERLVEVALLSGALKQSLDQACDQVGLDRYEVRSWTGWHRSTTFCLIALAWAALQQHRQRTLP